MRKKLNEIRRNLREEEVNQYKQNIRESMLDSMIKESKVSDLTKELQRCIKQKNTEEYFEKYMSTTKDVLFALGKDIVLSSYILYSDHLENFKNVILLQQLIANHFYLIFTSPQLEAFNVSTFERILEETNKIILNENLKSIDSSQHLQCESYFSILNYYFAPKNRKNLARYLKGKDIKFLYQSIISWSKIMLENATYLQLLSHVILHPISIEVEQFLTSLFANWDLIQQLSQQIIDQNSKISYFSLVILNNILKNIQYYSEERIKYLIPNYLQGITLIYEEIKDSQFSNKTSYYKKSNLIQTLGILQKLLKVIRREKYEQVNIGLQMQKNGTFLLFSLINQIEHFPQRCLIYGVIEHSIHIISELEHGDEVLRLILLELKDTLVLGLGNKFSNNITLNSIRSIQMLLQYHTSHHDIQIIIDGFCNAGILTILEYLQFNKNSQISAIASSLLDHQLREYSYNEQVHITLK